MDPDDFNADFQLCPPQVMNPTAEVKQRHNLVIIFKLLIDFLQLSSMTSRGVSRHPWWTPDNLASLHTCFGLCSRPRFFCDSWWIYGVLIYTINGMFTDTPGQRPYQKPNARIRNHTPESATKSPESETKSPESGTKYKN